MKKIKIITTIVVVMSFIISCQKNDFEITKKNDASQNFIQNNEDYFVSQDQALEKLYEFVSTTNNNLQKSYNQNPQIKSTYTTYKRGCLTKNSKETKDTAIVHIFNFKEGGFAIVSADKRTTPILAYTEAGEINPNEEITDTPLIVILSYLDYIYQEEINNYQNDSLPQKNLRKSTSQQSYPTLGETKWHQRDPYNSYCPIKDGQHCLTGCVATATAQLMSIHRHPYGYNNQRYDWTQMIKDLYQTQTAILMHELGKEMDADYGLNETSIKCNKVPKALEKFGYKNGGKISDYNEKTIANEIINKYPVLVYGYAQKETKKFLGIQHSKYSHGHMWLIDGLRIKNDNYYFRCNFGWGKDYIGYYLSKNFDSNNKSFKKSSVDYTPGYYKFELSMITGIRK